MWSRPRRAVPRGAVPSQVAGRRAIFIHVSYLNDPISSKDRTVDSIRTGQGCGVRKRSAERGRR